MNKRVISLLLVMVLAMTMLAGCGGKEDEVKTPETTGETGETTETVEDLKVGLVLAGGRGDRSFYDSATEGVEKAAEDLGVEHKIYECRNDPTLIKDQIVQASEYADIVVAVGFEFYDAVQEMTKEFTDVDYIYVDNAIDGVDNLFTISYAENEGSFLAGALAAMMTSETSIEGINEEKIVGMVGGEDIEVIRNFQAGYEAGAKYVDEEVEVKTVFAEDFEDPAKGKENATMLYSMGADIIFQVAGKTGEGVFEAAEEHGQYAIGVDSDQRYINPDRIVASMVKEVGKSIYDTIEKIQNGTETRGEVIVYSLAEDGVGLSYGDDGMDQIVTDEMKAEIEDIKAKILSGEIVVPTSEDLD